jgi:hypothetical protein
MRVSALCQRFASMIDQRRQQRHTKRRSSTTTTWKEGDIDEIRTTLRIRSSSSSRLYAVSLNNDTINNNDDDNEIMDVMMTERRARSSKIETSTTTTRGRIKQEQSTAKDTLTTSSSSSSKQLETKTTKTTTTTKDTQIKQITTEVIWELERKGEGWGEEIFPSLKQKRRVIEPLSTRKRLSNLQTYVEDFLVEVCGFTEDEAVATFSAAAAWRITAQGRALVDRKRMRLIAENIHHCISVFERIGLSEEEIREVVRAAPQLLAVSPLLSKWNNSLLEYAARQLSESGGTEGRVRMRERTGRPALRDEAGNLKDSYYSRTIGVKTREQDSLRGWVLNTRSDRKSGGLAQEQLYLLDIVGFDALEPETRLTQANVVWERWFDELVGFQCITGNCDPSYSDREKGGLGKWVATQRALYKDGGLSKKREFRLRTLGLKLDEDEGRSKVSVVNMNFRGGLTAFDESTSDMAIFLAERGQYAEPPLGSPLAVWLMNTREMAERGELTEGQMNKLKIIGVDLTPISAAWLKKLSEMSEYVKMKRVVSLTQANSIKAWIEDQRVAHEKGKLSDAQIKRLEALDPIVFKNYSRTSESPYERAR